MAVQNAENGVVWVVRRHSRSWAMPPFDRAHTTSYSTFSALVGGDPGRISRRSLASENYRVPGLSCGVVRVILCLTVLVGLRLVTDGQTDGHRAMAITADAYHRAVTSPDLNEARDDGVLRCQWHQLYHMQTIRTLLQTDNHTNTASLNF